MCPRFRLPENRKTRRQIRLSVRPHHAHTAQGFFTVAGHEHDIAVVPVELLQAVYGVPRGGAAVGNQRGERVGAAVVADGGKTPNRVGNKEKLPRQQAVLPDRVAGQGDGGKLRPDAVALFERMKRRIQPHGGKILDKADAFGQVFGQQVAQEALADFGNTVFQAARPVRAVYKIVGGAGKDDLRGGKVAQPRNVVGMQVRQEHLPDFVRRVAQMRAQGGAVEGNGGSQGIESFGKTAAGFKKARGIAGVENQTAAAVADVRGHGGEGGLTQAAAAFNHAFGVGAEAGVVEADVHSVSLSGCGRTAAARPQCLSAVHSPAGCGRG